MPTAETNSKTFIKKFWPRKLGLQLALYVSLLLALSMAGFSWHTINEQVVNITENMQLQAKVLANNLSAVSAVHLLTQDYSSIEQLLIRAVEFPGVHKIQLSNAEGKLLGDITRFEGKEPEVKYGQTDLLPPNDISVLVNFDEQFMTVWHPIVLGELIGWVKITNSLEPIVSLKESLITELVLEGIAIILCLYFCY